MKKLFFYSTVHSMLLRLCMIMLVLWLSGCTLHFKSKELEIDTERQRVQNNETFKLDKAELL